MTGPLRVYRVPGSVAFLNSGRTLHPILPKSQCWCVDGETKFVLRIRQNNYYRIELPNDCSDDLQVADSFRVTLDKVLQYEKTPCPFERAFTIELPQSPQTPKRPWRPKHRPISLKEVVSQTQSGSEDSAATSEVEDSIIRTDEDHIQRSGVGNILLGSSDKAIKAEHSTLDLSSSIPKTKHVEGIAQTFKETRTLGGSDLQETSLSFSPSSGNIESSNFPPSWENIPSRDDRMGTLIKHKQSLGEIQVRLQNSSKGSKTITTGGPQALALDASFSSTKEESTFKSPLVQ